MRHFLAAMLLLCVTSCEGLVIDAPEASTPAPMPEVATPVGSGATAVPDASLPAGGLREAVARTRRAQFYRGTFNFTTTITNGAEVRSDTFLAYEAAVQGDKSQVTYVGGTFNEILGGGERIEVVNADGKTYMRGGSLFGTAEPDRWYVFPDSRMTDFPLDSEDIVQIVGEDFGGARAGEATVLDSQTCAVWHSEIRAGAAKLVEWMIGKSASGAAHGVESAEARYAVCEDGYVHQMEWVVAARNGDGSDERAGIVVRARRFAFGAPDIRIVAPQGAIEIR